MLRIILEGGASAGKTLMREAIEAHFGQGVNVMEVGGHRVPAFEIEERYPGELAAAVQGYCGIRALYADVHEFHRVFDHPARFTPGLQPADRVTARADWIDEEVGELRDAKNIYDQADAYIDIIYFAVGGLVEMGVDPSELWRIVHGANMAKVQPDGTVKRREDGKIIKPDGWRAPDEAIAEEVNRQIGADATPLFDEARRGPIFGDIGGAAGDVLNGVEDAAIDPAIQAIRDRTGTARDAVARAQGTSY